ncbi:MAG: regulatory protein RecX [Thiotrichales bacterium]|nr:MAG: regulatory protein RecX [Thiotrichales bacterium]
MLARREHSAFEIRRKLKQKDLPESEIEEAVERLQQEGLLSDRRYAEAYINMRAGKGYGPLRIALELKERGVAESDFRPYLNTGNMDWWSALTKVCEKKYGSTRCEDYKEKAKRIRYLHYRGFALDEIHELLE